MLANALRASGEMLASLPPAKTTSASPPRIRCRASMKAVIELAQAATEARTGPCSPSSIETWQAAMFGAIVGTKKALARCTPRRCASSCSSKTVLTPPPPVLSTTPMRSGSSASRSRRESSSARRAAATPIWENRAMRLAALPVM